jgi:hypothetical protein
LRTAGYMEAARTASSRDVGRCASVDTAGGAQADRAARGDASPVTRSMTTNSWVVWPRLLSPRPLTSRAGTPSTRLEGFFRGSGVAMLGAKAGCLSTARKAPIACPPARGALGAGSGKVSNAGSVIQTCGQRHAGHDREEPRHEGRAEREPEKRHRAAELVAPALEQGHAGRAGDHGGLDPADPLAYAEPAIGHSRVVSGHRALRPVVAMRRRGRTLGRNRPGGPGVGVDRTSAPSCPEACGRRSAIPSWPIGPCFRPRCRATRGPIPVRTHRMADRRYPW